MSLSRFVASPCPRCRQGTVRVCEVTWPGGTAGEGRSVWADEPLRCSFGCTLTPTALRRVLWAVYDGRPSQLPLPEAAG